MIVQDLNEQLKLPESAIAMAAAQYNIDLYLLTAIVLVESSGNRYATRHQKNYRYVFRVRQFSKDLKIPYLAEKNFQQASHGYVQIMGATARILGFKGYPAQLYEPETNIRYGAKLLAELGKRYASDVDVIAAYNAGSARKRKDGTYQNQRYVDKIIRRMDLLKRRGGI